MAMLMGGQFPGREGEGEMGMGWDDHVDEMTWAGWGEHA